MQKKPEEGKARRLVECVCPPGSDAEAEGDEKQIGTGTKSTGSSGRKRSDNLLRGSSKEKKILAFKCLCFNAQSLRNKMSELLATVTAKDPEIIRITESWGDEKISDAEFSIPGYSMYRSDRTFGHRNGGVLLYVKADLNAVQVTDQIWCKINITSGNELYIGVCYRSPTVAIYGNDNNSLLCHLLKEVQG